MIEHIIRQYDFNLLYSKALVANVTEDQMTFTPSKGLLNHPAFTLGHLVTGSAMIAEDLGAAMAIPDGWSGLFQRNGPDDQTRPDADTAKYPHKGTLLTELEKQHDLVKQYLLLMTKEQLQQSVNWRFSLYMPTLLDVVMFMCISHEQMHLGQLAAWRRAMDLPAALGTL